MELERRLSVEEEIASIDEFFRELTPPSNLIEVSDKVKEFCKVKNDRRVVLVTSGGTTVPLEHNTVRFVDNFSAGTRGSASAEYFLKNDYAVIFLYRIKSLEPFIRHINLHTLFTSLTPKRESGETYLQVNAEMSKDLLAVVNAYNEKKDDLLTISFTTLSEYLHYLREITFSLRNFGSSAMLYLAAAVSDFYVPSANMSTHKIHSASGPLRLHLDLVPKVLRPLVKFWVPYAFVVSFKLETDEKVIHEKAIQALAKYGHKLVIANLLHSRKYCVTLINQESSEVIAINEDDKMEIESIIIERLISRHTSYMKS